MSEFLNYLLIAIPAVLIFWLGMIAGKWAYKQDIKMGREYPPKRKFDFNNKQ